MEAVQARGTERLVLRIGEISATSRTVLTPSGSAPVNEARWTVKEAASPRSLGWRRALRRAASADAAALTVALTVTVRGPGWQHTETVGPATREEAAAIRATVTQARMLALRSVVWSPVTTSQPSPAEVPGGLTAPAR
jgi:hypothetical protein